MSEDPTKNLSNASFEERVLAELAATRQELAEQREFNQQLLGVVRQLDSRLTSLEDKVDARLRETRPIWDDVQARVKNIEAELRQFNRQLRVLIQDSFNMRSRLDDLEDRMPAA